MAEIIQIQVDVQGDLATICHYWNEPKHIEQWHSASPDWHTINAQNDLRVGGSLTSRMEAKDGAMGFDFGGVYTEVVANQRLSYTLGDGREVTVAFSQIAPGLVHVVETFEAESQNPVELQKQGWQAILNHFKEYVEENV
ncbi:SRPBCC domain-containing protein [Enterococcus cecorum]|nr:SRPBCC domain-containing protein [Enterococcus cecorum]